MKQSRVIEYRPMRSGLPQTVRDFLAVRGKNGLYGESLRLAARGFRREPSRVKLKILGVHALRMMLGDRLMNAVLSDRAVVVTGACRAEDPETGDLYHFAPTDCVERILSTGLLPRDRYVFLTDAPEYAAQTFLRWKARQLHATTAFTLLRVDVQRLLQDQAVFRTDREHEFVTGGIDARFLSIEPEQN